MDDDPIVAEVRKARDDYARRFNYDLEAIVKDLQEKEKRHGSRLVSFPPKRPPGWIEPGRASSAEPPAHAAETPPMVEHEPERKAGPIGSGGT